MAKGFAIKQKVDCTLPELDRQLTEVKGALKGQHCEILFYFAGHAVERNGQNALLCLDSDPQLVECSPNARDTKIVVILDCCRESTLQPMPTMVKFPRHGQFYVLFACGSGQRAQESLMYGHGIFTSELAKFINSQSKFNMTSETVACVTEAVAKRTCNLQRPELLSRSSKRWSAQVWNVPHRNKRFVGRSVLIDQLASRLTEPGLLCLVATSGLPGVGKSQLLIEFVNSR